MTVIDSVRGIPRAHPRIRPRLPRATHALLLVALGATCAAVEARSPAAQEPAFGRLFHTPAQRAALDQGRERALSDGTRAAPAQAAPPPAVLSVDGIVRRDDGRTTVWINQQPTRAPAEAGAVRVGPVRDAGDAVELRMPDAGRRLRLKVGQEADPDSGEVRDHYRRAPPPAVAPSPPPAKGPAEASPTAPAQAVPARRSAREAGDRRDAPAVDEVGGERTRPAPGRSVP